METESNQRVSRQRRWLVAAAVALVVPLLELVAQFLSGRGNVWRLAYWAVETPLLMFALTAHHEYASRRGKSAMQLLVTSLCISLVIGAACALTFLQVVVPLLDIKLERPQDHAPLGIVAAFGFGTMTGLVQCAVWTLGYLYPITAEDMRLRALEAENLKLETEQLRSAAELSRIRTQLEPHFLLNTLNAIAGLVTQHPRDARRLLGALGDLLSDALVESDELQTLDEQVTWLRRYAEILESRHSGALRFQWHVADDTRSALVPRLLLQPLVENAVNHGALHRSGGGKVTIRTALENGMVVCIVEDDGPGMGDRPPRSGAFGLRSVRRRVELELEGASFEMESSPSGTQSIVRFPAS